MHRGQINATAWAVAGVAIVALCLTGYDNGKYDHDLSAFRDWFIPAVGVTISAVGYLCNSSTRHWKHSRRNAGLLMLLWVLWCSQIGAVAYTFYLDAVTDIEIAEAMRSTRLLMILVAGMGAASFWAIDHKGAAGPVEQAG